MTVILVDSTQVDEKLKDMSGATSSIGLGFFLSEVAHPWLSRRIGTRFDSQGDGASGPWPALATNTIGIRRSKGFPPGPINVRTGAMKRFLMSSKRVRLAGHVGTLTIPDTPRGEMKNKIKISQEGGYPVTGGNRAGPSRPAPPRPALALGPMDATALRTHLAQYIAEGGT